MTSPISVPEVRAQLQSVEQVQRNAFGILRSISDLMRSRPPADTEVQELILRALDKRSAFGPSEVVLDALVREVGLFPYLLEPENLGLADRIAYEYHRPEGLAQAGFVFHRPQAAVFRELMAGRSVVLSAPTSFGKSLIVDAVIASMRYKNLLIVVPTIALIDETRRRLAAFSANYKIITHGFQEPAERNVYVMTQERVLEQNTLPRMDFFVIDEFYKLTPHDTSDGRADLLNQVFYKLARLGTQFYMLGPSVTGVVPDLQQRFKAVVVNEPYHTVVSQLHVVPRNGKNELIRLVDLCSGLTGSTIIFCRSVPRAQEVVNSLLEHRIGKPSPELSDAADWIARNYHSEWHVARALRESIGVHHGRIPRALGQWMVRRFNDESIKFLVCTSTLIEGVNTKAQNIIVLDDKIDKTRYDLFTFNNIRGRSGRMFKHFVGHVYLFHEPPTQELPLIDVPSVTQSGAASTGLLMQIDESDLSDRSVQKLKSYRDQGVLSYETLRANNGVDPDMQLSAAKAIVADLANAHGLMTWRAVPTFNQLVYACDLIWKHFGGATLGGRSIRSARQLAFQLIALQDRKSTSVMVAEQVSRGLAVDAAVQQVLDFHRLWAMFHAPRLLRTLSRIQADIFGTRKLPAGSYDIFAARVESLFMDSALVALDEYGVPLQLSRRMRSLFSVELTLDSALATLRDLDVAKLKNISGFERSLLLEAQEGL